MESLRARGWFLLRVLKSGVAHVGELWQKNLLVGIIVLLALLGVTIAPLLALATRLPAVVSLIILVIVVIVDGAYIEWKKAQRLVVASGEDVDLVIQKLSPGTRGWLLRHADFLPTGRVGPMDMNSDCMNELNAAKIATIEYVGSGSWSGGGPTKPDHPRPRLTPFGSVVLERLKHQSKQT